MTMHEVEQTWIPRSFAPWLCAQWFFFAAVASVAGSRPIKGSLQKWFGPKVKATIVAQYVLGMMHVFMTLTCGIAYAYRDWLRWDTHFVHHGFADFAIGLSFTYFVVDGLVIVTTDLENQSLYLIHHAIAAFMGACMSLRVTGLTETSQYMFVLEFSNMFLSVWDFLKRFHKSNPARLRPWYDAVTPAFAATYVPCRTVVLSIVTWNLLKSIKTGTRDDIVAALWIATLFILVMSWAFAVKVASIGRRVTLEKYPWLLSFANLTYVFKAYVTLVYFMLPPTFSKVGSKPPGGLVSFDPTFSKVGVLVVDAAHIVASLVYWSTDGTSKVATSCDFIAVCTKIVTNGLYVYGRSYLQGDHANMWWWSCAMALNVAVLIHGMVKEGVKHLGCTGHKEDDKDRIVECFYSRDLTPYAIHFLLSTMAPLMLRPIVPTLYVSSGLYLTGAIVWTMFPNWKGSVGWMHLCITAGDVALFT